MSAFLYLYWPYSAFLLLLLSFSFLLCLFSTSLYVFLFLRRVFCFTRSLSHLHSAQEAASERTSRGVAEGNRKARAVRDTGAEHRRMRRRGRPRRSRATDHHRSQALSGVAFHHLSLLTASTPAAPPIYLVEYFCHHSLRLCAHLQSRHCGYVCSPKGYVYARASSEKQQVPVVFALSRNLLGRALGRRLCMSVVGVSPLCSLCLRACQTPLYMRFTRGKILNADGAYELYTRMLELARKGREEMRRQQRLKVCFPSFPLISSK